MTISVMQETRYDLAWDIPRLLTWRSGLQTERNILTGYQRWLFGRLLLWSRALDGSLFERVSRLPQEHQKRLLLAPEISRLLRSTKKPTAEDKKVFQGHLEVQEWLVRTPEGQAPPIGWTALGDKGFGLLSCGVPSCIPDSFMSEGEYSAPWVANIVLDPYSPYRNTTSSEDALNCSLGMYDEREVSNIQELLSKTLGFIAGVNTDAATFIRFVTKAIAVSKAPGNYRRLYSSSWRGMIGLITLVNCEKFSSTVIAGRLIHESVHSVLYALELLTSLYIDENMAQDGKAVSPWSGKILSVKTFMHACCVWFALWSFWSLCPDSDPEVRASRKQSALGFLGVSPLSALGDKERASVHPDLRLAIENMTACVLADSVESLGIAGDVKRIEQPA